MNNRLLTTSQCLVKNHEVYDCPKREKDKKLGYNPNPKVLCCHPETLITTRRGYIPINQIKNGDSVLTHKGRWQNVTEIFKQEYNGELIKLQSYGCGRVGPMITPEHPVLTEERNTSIWMDTIRGKKRFRADDRILRKGSITDKQVEEMRKMRSRGMSLRELSKKFNQSQASVSLIVNKIRRNYPMENTISWNKAESVKSGWKCYVPLIPIKNNIPVIELKGVIKGNKVFAPHPSNPTSIHPIAKALPRTVLFTKTLARLFGLYIAEGNTNKQGITFSFNINETDYHAFVLSTIKNIFKIKGTIVKREKVNCVQIRFCSTVLRDFFGETFGKGAHNVMVPFGWVDINKELLSGLISGIFDGDGCVTEKHTNLTTVSKTLAYQAKDILHSLKIGASISYAEYPTFLGNKYRNTKAYKVTVNDIRSYFKVIEGENISEGNSKSAKWDDTGSWHVLKESKKNDYNGFVYNIEVENDNSYVANGVAVHDY